MLALTDALSELTCPNIGMCTKKSQLSLTSLEMPFPSDPITTAIFPL